MDAHRHEQFCSTPLEIGKVIVLLDIHSLEMNLFMWLNILKFTKTNLAVDFSIGGSRDGQGVQCSRTTVTSEASFVVDSIFHCKLLSFKNGSTTSVIEMSFYHLRVTLLPHLLWFHVKQLYQAVQEFTLGNLFRHLWWQCTLRQGVFLEYPGLQFCSFLSKQCSRFHLCQ